MRGDIIEKLGLSIFNAPLTSEFNLKPHDVVNIPRGALFPL